MSYLDSLRCDPSKGKVAYSFSSRSDYLAKLNGFVVQSFLKANSTDHYEHEVHARTEYEFDCGRSETIISHGQIFYSFNGSIVHLNSHHGDHELTCNEDHKDIIEKLKTEIRSNNPLRGKFVQVVTCDDEFRVNIKNPPTTELAECILDASTAADLFENTIDQLDIGADNGIILYGPPGTGKSMVCKAVAHAALKKGYTVCLVTQLINFSQLAYFVDRYLAPCIVIFEDIDSYAGERLQGEGRFIADLLQMLSGIEQRERAVVSIATTNHLDLLDKAVRNRPVRFNRKYALDLPSDHQIDMLIDKYFGVEVICPAQKSLCYQRGYTGSHIAELKRTVSNITRREKCDEGQAFERAIQTVEKHFPSHTKTLGFN